MIGKRQLIAVVLSGVMALTLGSPALAKSHKDNDKVTNEQKDTKDTDTKDTGKGNEKKNKKDQSNVKKLLIPLTKASNELNKLENKVNAAITRALQKGDYSQLKTALTDYIAAIDEIEIAGKAEQTVKADYQQLVSDQKLHNTDAVESDTTTLKADIEIAIAAIETASDSLETVIQDLEESEIDTPEDSDESDTDTPDATQSATPTITGTLIAGDTSVSGTAVAGASVILSLNGTAQPDVTADESGNWTVSGLTLATGDTISVTAQVSGDTVSNAATVTVGAATLVQTETPTITGTPIAGDTSVSGAAVAGASMVLSVNGTAQPAVTADESGKWTVSGLTLATGDTISVTAQVSGDTVSEPATAAIA